MSILSKILSKKDTQDYFLTLGVEEHRIRAAVSHISGNKIKIIGTGESDYSQGENESEAADIAISTAEKNLDNNILVEKVIFALPLTYLDDDKVKPEYLARLKKITKDLGLKPHGFVEYPDAISYYLEKEEGAPPTTILLAFERDSVICSLIRIGKIQQNIITPRTTSLSSDFENILPDFKTEILPSKIIIYDEEENLEDIREELLRFPWHKHSVFLHTPKIKILSSSEILTSLVTAAGSSLLKSLPNSALLDKSYKNVVDKQLKEDHNDENINKPDKKLIQEEQTLIPVVDQSVAKQLIKDKSEDEDTILKEDILESSEVFGFKKDQDIAVRQTIPETIGKSEFSPETSSQKNITKTPNIFNFLKSPSFKIPKLSINFKFKSNIIIVVIPFIVFIILFGYLVKYYPKAMVNLIIYPQIITNNYDILLTTNPDQVSQEKNVIIAKNVTVETNGEKTIPTTGKTKIGDKASGIVTIYNKTLSSKTLPKNTILQRGNLNFTLETDINIASASDTGEGLTYGKANVKVTSSIIGPENNLSSGNNFTIKDFPSTSFIAKNDDVFTGGTSRDISSVSLEDQKTLENLLDEELISKARIELAKKVEPNEKLIDISQTKEYTSKKFSHQIGSETKEISLSASAKISALSYKDQDLLKLSVTNQSLIPLGFGIDNKRTNVQISKIELDKTGVYKMKAKITSFLLPNIDKVTIQKNIAGKSYDQVSSYLKTLSFIGGFRIIEDDNLPLLKNKLPYSPNNIIIKITSY